MFQWHLAPDYILDHWTEDQLILYVTKHNERRHREEHPEEEPPDYAAAARERYLAWLETQPK